MDATLLTYPTLSHNGFPCRWEGRRDFKEARIDLIRWVIRASIKPAKSYKVGSYGGKHYVEHLSGTYVSNGEFILAMILEGYTHSKPIAGRPNVCFKANYIASPEMVTSLSYDTQQRQLCDEILARHWGGMKKVQTYKNVTADVTTFVKRLKGDKERVEDVIGHD